MLHLSSNKWESSKFEDLECLVYDMMVVSCIFLVNRRNELNIWAYCKNHNDSLTFRDLGISFKFD